MSITLAADVTSAEAGRLTAYQVSSVGQIRIVTGTVPVTDLVSLINSVPADSVMDMQLAQMLGANFVFGPKAELDAYRESAFVRNSALLRAKHEMPEASDEVLNWLAFGERGASSNSMFRVMMDLPHGRAEHPHDASDFRRCRLLLEAIPSIAHRLPMLSDASPEWAAIIAAWDSLCESLDAECPDWRSGEQCKASMTNLAIFKVLEPFQNNGLVFHHDHELNIRASA